LVERVVKVLPHEQCTVASTYCGWMSFFMNRRPFDDWTASLGCFFEQE
jgi:hypothetical protein